MEQALLTLAGVIVGGAITFLSAYQLESLRWKRETKRELLRDKRLAMSEALRWLEPMEVAIGIINLRVMAYIYGDISKDTLLSEWPNLTAQLARLDLEEDKRLLLPERVYQDGVAISEKVSRQIRIKAVEAGQALQHPNPEVQQQGKQHFQELWDELNTLDSQMKLYKEKLRSAYKSTYE